MPRRGENIYKRADGRWEARYIHHYESGRAVYRSLYAPTYREAKAKKTKALASLLSTPRVKTTASVTFGELAGQWLSDVRITVKESTFTRYHRVVTKYLIPQFQDQSLKNIDPAYLAGITERLMCSGGASGRALSAKTVTDILSVLKSILKYAEENDYPTPNWHRLKYPPRERGKAKSFSPESRQAIAYAISRSEDPTCLGVCFAYYTGVRIGELCGLQWGDIDFGQHTVTIQRTVERIANLDPAAAAKTKIVITKPKTNASIRTIPLPDHLLHFIQRFRKPAEVYLLTGTKKYTEPSQFYLRYQKFLKENHIPPHSFHTLRHTFATRCVENGFDVKTLSEILGHNSVTTTLSAYVHPSMEQKRRMLESLAPVMESLVP